MKTSHGVIQGYDGVAAVDSKHQIVVQAEAYGQPQEHDLLEPMIEKTRDNFKSIDSSEDVFNKAKLTADAGFHTEANMKMLAEENIDGYVADTCLENVILALQTEIGIRSATEKSGRN